MSYIIYGKRTKEIVLNSLNILPIMTKFRALDYKGVPVSKLSDAGEYATRQDAQNVVDKAVSFWKKKNMESYFVFEIRKAK